MPHPPTSGADVAVVGGGLIGLSIALELACRGASVRVFERGEPGSAASWAAAGMLAPLAEGIEDRALEELCRLSLQRYPSFVGDVASLGGVDPHLRLDGILKTAFDDDGLAELSARRAVLVSQGVRCELVDRGGALTLEPALGKQVRGGLRTFDEGVVDNRRLGRALVAACEALRVSIVREATDVAVECDRRRVLGVRSHRGFFPATWVVNAAGAWAAAVPGLPAAAVPAVEPVKGQMLALGMPQGFIRRPTWVPGAYLVPRDDGRLLIGATVERRGFDTRVTAEGMSALLAAALKSVPSLRDFAITETWAGLRPGTADGRPFIGPTDLDGLLIATGHYRNGILLAPITAQMIADFVATRDLTPLLPWLPLRMNAA